ncbi:MAG: hypothetical protein IJ647_07990 [Prevotella sp.]|nr:hypothetical protein [Prevotella sp.]
MEQLKKAYEAIEMLRALELPVSNEQLEGIAKLEKEYLQQEVIPLLKQEMEPLVEKIKGKFQMEVTYNKDEGLVMQLVDQSERKPASNSKDPIATRDTSKYSIDGGEPLKKRRFVLSVVRKFVDRHPGITYEHLKEQFPDSLSGSPLHGVFRPYNEIMRKLQSQPDLKNRFFLEPEDLITLSDGTKLTVFNQWGRHFPNFLEVAKQLHKVESFSSND